MLSILLCISRYELPSRNPSLPLYRTNRIQHGMLRIELPATAELNIWNTAAPPDLAAFRVILYPLKFRVFHFIDLHNIFGLTFSMSSHGVCNIHGHTRERPSAAEAIQRLRLSPTQRRKLRSIFVPLPPDEKILAIGVRWSPGAMLRPCFLVRPLPALQ